MGRDSYLVELSRYIHLNPVRAKMVEKPQEYPYSSYNHYVSKAKRDILTTDLVLDMLTRNRKEAIKRYHTYVEGATGEEIENPLSNVYGGMILGENAFIKRILKRLKREVIEVEEISNRRAMWAARGMEDVVDRVAKRFKMSRDEVISNRDREARKVAVYLIKKHTGITNKKIGEYFGGLSYSGVSKVVERITKQMEGDRKLSKIIRRMERDLSQVRA